MCEMTYFSVTLDSYKSGVHEIDTRQSTSLTVFDGTPEDESKLAKQFWNSLVLIPPVESTLVCTEINQRIRSRTRNDGKPKRNTHLLFPFLIHLHFNFCLSARFSTTKTKMKGEKSIRSDTQSTTIHQANTNFCLL